MGAGRIGVDIIPGVNNNFIQLQPITTRRDPMVDQSERFDAIVAKRRASDYKLPPQRLAVARILAGVENGHRSDDPGRARDRCYLGVIDCSPPNPNSSWMPRSLSNREECGRQP